MRWRKRVWDVLEIAEEGDKVSRFADFALFFLVGANVLAIILESVPSIYNGNKVFFDIFEIVSVMLFSAEYLFRLWSCVEDPAHLKDTHTETRLKFMGSSIALIDLAAILPFYLQFIFPGIDLRFLRVLRMLRILKLTRYSSAMNLLLRVLYQERAAFSAAFTILIMVLILVSCGIYLVEFEAQPEAFGSIPAAMWWAMATLTTVGYGDVTPITAMGKLFGAVVTVVGVGMVALPAGILASSFSELLRRRQQEYRLSVKKALEDGNISDEEEAELEEIRKELNLSHEDSDELKSQTKKEVEVNREYETDILRSVEGETLKEAEERLEKDLEKILDRGIPGHPNACPHCGSHLPEDGGWQ
ncbi:MAG: ion transporter [Alphaproteobacteria bacterium]|nr:ion transporter [Rhodospirillales bacterium]MCW9045616.1 ion transporter [Alphaproteobacteria bacterium]